MRLKYTLHENRHAAACYFVFLIHKSSSSRIWWPFCSRLAALSASAAKATSAEATSAEATSAEAAEDD